MWWDGGRGREKALGSKQKPKTSQSQRSDSGDTRTGGEPAMRGSAAPPAKAERQGGKIKHLCEWPEKRVERGPEWKQDKSVKRQDCHQPMSTPTPGKQRGAADKSRERKGGGTANCPVL